jgi:hypothetical protein
MGGREREWRKGGEMTQTLYAHMNKIKIFLKTMKMQKKMEFVFVNFDDHDEDQIVIQKYRNVCCTVVADSCQLIYMGDKYW